MRLAIFDFDGTISRADSFADFLYVTFGPVKFFWGLLQLCVPLTLYVLKIHVNGKTKAIVLRHFFGGYEQARFAELCARYARESLPRLLKQSALDRLAWHQAQGHEVIVVSASPEDYLRTWCERQGIQLLGTQLEIKDGKLSGNLASLNCYGDEKVRRLKEKYDLSQFDYIYAYGDSKGDLALKSIAHEFHYRNFQ